MLRANGCVTVMMWLFVMSVAAMVAAAATDCKNFTCSECATTSLVCAWCFEPSHFLPEGSLVGSCRPRNVTGKSWCFFNQSDSECLCAAGVTGCQSCQQWSAGCAWCGGRVHRGIGFCANSSWSECGAAAAAYAQVGSCPVPGVETYITWLVSIGFGIVLAVLVVLIAYLRAREHNKQAAKVVSSLFSDSGSEDGKLFQDGVYKELN